MEDVRRVGELAAELHAIAPGVENAPREAESAPPGVNGEDVPPAVDAAFSLAQQIRVIRSRYAALDEFSRSAGAYEEVRQFVAEVDSFRRIEELITRATSGVDGAGELGRREWRINSGDFGPQNLLFPDDGQVTAVDWEAGGWDDAARLAMGFVAHATSEDLSDEARAEFLGVYAEKRGLSDEEIRRFETVGALLDLEWVAIYASAMTPEVVAFKEFANPEFDLHAYLTGAANRARQRLERAEDGRGYRF